MAMNYEPLTFVLIVSVIMSVLLLYIGAGKKSLIPLYLGICYGVMWSVFALLVKFFA